MPIRECAHEEADTKIACFLSLLIRDDGVMVVSPDMDGLVIILPDFYIIPGTTAFRLGKHTLNTGAIREKT